MGAGRRACLLAGRSGRMSTAQLWLLASLALPWLGVPLAVCIRPANGRDASLLLLGILTAMAVFMLYRINQSGESLSLTLLPWLPGIALRFSVEPIGLLFALVATRLWPVTHLYAIGYMRKNNEANQPRFYACMAASIGCAVGMAFSANLLTTFLFYEMMTLCTYPLVTHAGDEESRQSGRRYLFTLLGASLALLLPAMLIIWHLAGTLDYAAGGILSSHAQAPWLGIILLLAIYGVAKAALMPIHRWLPAAMVAPVPVSALLHAVAVVKAGVFLIAKLLVYVFGTATLATYAFDHPLGYNWLPVMAGATVVLAGLIALRKDKLKSRLAYSTIAQLSYITLALSTLKGWAVIGAVYHIAAHAAAKICLFFAAGNIATMQGKTKVSELNGIGRAMPWTMGAFALASLSIIGLPPTAGFISKWWMLRGMLEAEDWFAVIALATGSLLSAAYLLPIIYRAFFLPAVEEKPGMADAPWTMLIPTVGTAIACILLFFLSPFLLQLLMPLKGGTP
ncbi:monovalent cation/H+ antiporter subunit D family protein [bacterium]|nr:monovalent cation/H+ antiporter subunit D family protein [bacterium]